MKPFEFDLKKTKSDTTKSNDQVSIEELLSNGELGVMTECAYGQTIADKESNKKINTKNN